MTLRSKSLFLCALVVLVGSMQQRACRAFVPTLSSSSSTGRSRHSVASLQMVFGSKQALAMEKLQNPKQFESTIRGLMKAQNLSRSQAEARYGEFLADPDGFALRASAEERRLKGYKDWKEQAIAKSDDPEATRKRIDEFQKRNSIKGTAIILVFFSAVAFYNTVNPYVPPPVH